MNTERIRRHKWSLVTLFVSAVAMSLVVSAPFTIAQPISIALIIAALSMGSYTMGRRDVIASMEKMAGGMPKNLSINESEDGYVALIETNNGDVKTLPIPNEVIESGRHATMLYLMHELAR